MKYCVFQLYGPLMSWGDIAIGGERRSFPHPTKSAIIGVIAAALGIKRDNEKSQQLLSKTIGFGIKLISPGIMVRDFHTAQTPANDKKVRFYSRRDELAMIPERIDTVLSRREYRCDSMAHVAVWIRDAESDITIEAISDALQSPAYHLYLGRKSCPPAIPLSPRIVEAKDMKSAFDDVVYPSLSSLAATSEQQRKYFEKTEQRIFYENHISYYWEKDAVSGIDYAQKMVRYDLILSRRRWQFAPRDEYMCVIERGDENVHE